MSNSEFYRRKAEALLRQAADAPNMRERGRFIDEAMHWHTLALEADGHMENRATAGVGAADADEDDGEREGTRV
jgi:hypothetical protein